MPRPPSRGGPWPLSWSQCFLGPILRFQDAKGAPAMGTFGAYVGAPAWEEPGKCPETASAAAALHRAT